jgi:hypothetical protein
MRRGGNGANHRRDGDAIQRLIEPAHSGRGP